MKKGIKILLVALGVWFLIFLIDFVCVKTINRPIFMINTLIYKDGGTKVYHGLGYKVIKYNTIEGYNKAHIGTYFMKYNPKDVLSSKTDSAKFYLEYPEVGKNNVYKYRTIDEIIKILENGTGIVYLGFPECKWCQAYVPMLNEVAISRGLENIYYFNILDDRKNNTKEYKKIVELLDEYLQYDNEGEKRVYVPAVIAISKGEIVGFDDETAWDTKGFEWPVDYWTKDEVKLLKDKLKTMVDSVLGNSCSECNKK